MNQQSESSGTNKKSPEFLSLMDDIKASNAVRETYARKQYLMSQITAAACLVMLGIILYVSASILPRANAAFQSLDSIQSALNQVNSIDIDTLNQAIKNLSDVIEPLAKFFNRS